MSNVTLVLHLILALVLIGIVLLQRSEGGGLGIGGGGAMSGRQAATALGKVTWIFAVAFLTTSVALTIITAREQASDSVIERLGIDALPTEESPAGLTGDDLELPILDGSDLLPEGDAVLPPRSE